MTEKAQADACLRRQPRIVRYCLNRFSVFSPRRCSICFLLHGTVITRESYQDYVRTYNSKKEKYYSDTSSCFYEHDFCHCYFKCMRQILPGTATIHGILGADYSLAVSKKLPDYYISKKEARKTDWMSTVISAITATPSKMIGGDIFQNNENKLPAKEGRIWHEADINYVIGRRGNHRILYSNDGLIFVTYDHYRTFFLIPTFN